MQGADLPKTKAPAVHQPDFDSGDAKSVAKRQTLAEAELMREVSDMRAVLATPEGERTLYRLLGLTGLFNCSFNTNGLAGAFNEGKRQIGLLMLARIEVADPWAFIRMQTTNLNEKEATHG